MTVKELMKLLIEEDPAALVVVRIQDGFGYGGYPVFYSEPVTSTDIIQREDEDETINEFCLYFGEEDEDS